MTINNLFLEDLTIGQKFISGIASVEEYLIQEFGSQYDPQPFHTNTELAKNTFFKGLVASGWHTAAITMRLLVHSNLKLAGGLIGAGIDELRWPIPVYPGDELYLDIEVIETKRSASKPNRGFAKIKVLTKNQNEAIVMSYVATLVVESKNKYKDLDRAQE